MGAIVIRTRYDEGTESAEVATSELIVKCINIQNSLLQLTFKTRVGSFSVLDNLFKALQLLYCIRKSNVLIGSN